MALALKNYQQQALNALKEFYIHARVSNSKIAFEEMVNHRQAFIHERTEYINFFPDSLSDTPCVCLRVPTGGGKTLIAAHSIAITAKNYADSNAPVVLWLVPSDVIRQQTLKALSNVSHPYRQAVMQTYGDNIKVCDLDNLQTINPYDIGKLCLIIVTTIQSFNISKTEKRNVYAFFEELSPHFAGLTPQQEQGMERVDAATIEAQPYLTPKDIGRIKHSLANWFHLHRPIIILDEAHKSRTKLSFTTLKRLNPLCLVELTATPRNNNVLYSVSAAELKAAQMIKLPIILTEHPDGWQPCLRDAVLQRRQLETEAQQDAQYIRPILLIQAQPKGGEATVDVVQAYLINELNINEKEIAISTGAVKELNNVNLSVPNCSIRFVITVEALREGWDCPFAYVLASLQNMNSAVDVEQLLGRVLRMPYAQKRPVESLNKAYAHVIAESTAQAAANLKDRMINNMGFNRWEADMALATHQQGRLNLTLAQNSVQIPAIVPEVAVPLAQVPDTTNFSEEIKSAIQVHPLTSGGATLLIKKGSSTETFNQVERLIVGQTPKRKQVEIQQAFNNARAERQAAQAPEWYQTFALIPQLSLFADDEWQVVENEVIESLIDFDLLNYPLHLSFKICETANSYEIDMNIKERELTYRHLSTEQLHFNEMETEITENDLVTWLDQQVRQPSITQRSMRAYLIKLIGYLQHNCGFSFTSLVRYKFQLAQAIREEICRLQTLARKEAFQGELFERMTVAPIQTQFNQFEFKPGLYPVRQAYRGSYMFIKHFYAQIDDLREKNAKGQDTEEFICARYIDMHPNVKQWVRNIPKQFDTSFWLPIASGYFYPDFICELQDGSIAVIEYKGGHLVTNEDSKEKESIGLQWAKNSHGRRRFIMVKAKEKALDHSIDQQLAEILA
ncbi:DEAD/DEAH box helicase [Snodgrassella sp. ESL0253]|uniref:DEAD/DEAH box helicase n=1 Tax=Snodgrassella sp. ESL0253 TaxID=2705031 RepID=UPI0015822B6C|nr:DEAD/DEAH box helicase family protein [Snodgrassella sp. ESL0253]NUE66340.1 DEAD/DEAH box helicase family protein [Snodgrassella sp. ESL0253]